MFEDFIIMIWTVAIAHLFAVVSPGPDFIMVVKNSLSHGRREGIFTAIGIGTGLSVHIIYCVAGLALIISQSIIIFSLLKYLGAAYLIYVGYKSIVAKSSDGSGLGFSNENREITKDDRLTDMKAFRTGFITNVLNPKATLFFLSLFTLVISPSTPAPILLFISILMIVNTMLWFSFVAYVVSNPKVRTIFMRYQSVINKVIGGFFILVGIKLALSELKL